MQSSYSNLDGLAAAIITAAVKRDNETLATMLAGKDAAVRSGLKEAVYSLAFAGNFDTVNYLVDNFGGNRYVAAEGFRQGGFKEFFEKFTLIHVTEKNHKMNPLFFMQPTHSFEQYIVQIAYAATLNDNQAMTEIEYEGVKKGVNVKLALAEAAYQLAKTGNGDAALRLVNEYGANRHTAAQGFAEGGHDDFLAVLIASSLMHNTAIKMDIVAEGYALSGNVTGVINLYNDDLIAQETALDLLKKHGTETGIAEFNLAAAKKERLAAGKQAAEAAQMLVESKAPISNNPSTFFTIKTVETSTGNALDMVNSPLTNQRSN